MKMNQESVTKKLEKVLNKLMDLGDAKSTVTGLKQVGQQLFMRDFSMEFWDWPQGVGLYGLQRYNTEQTPIYEDYVKNWYNARIAWDIIPNVNTTAPLLTLVDYIDENAEYKELCLKWLQEINENFPKTKEGILQHMTSNATGDGVFLNEGEIWIDTLFMVVLFLQKMAKKTNNDALEEEALYQVLEHIKYLYNPKEGLFYHGWTFNDNSNFGGVYWCRGNSWFTLGIVDIIEQLDASKIAIKHYLTEILRNQVERLVTLQTPSGLWPTVLTNPDAYEEVSGSAAIAAGILKGVRLGLLDEKYRTHGIKAITAILEEIDDEGTVLKVSAGTGMGMDEQHYLNIAVSPIAYGQSLTAIALIEALHHC